MTKPMTGEEIIRRTAAAFGVSVEAIKSARRMRSLTYPRFAAMWLLRKHTAPNGLQRSLPQIGAMFGGRDHSTVHHGIDMAESLIGKDTYFTAVLLALDAGKEAYGPPWPGSEKPMGELVGRLRVSCPILDVVETETDDDKPEPSTLAFNAMIRSGSYALLQAIRREAA